MFVRKVIFMKTRLFKYMESFTSKTWKCPDKKNFDIIHISAQNRYWVLIRTTSNEYPHSMFLSRNKKNNVHVYSCKPKFYHTKVGFKGVKII